MLLREATPADKVAVLAVHASAFGQDKVSRLVEAVMRRALALSVMGLLALGTASATPGDVSDGLARDARLAAYEQEATNSWALGQEGVDIGILVTVAPAEQQVRIEPGYGMNRYISNADAEQIIDEAMLPAFGTGQLVEGITRGVEGLMAAGRAYVVQP